MATLEPRRIPVSVIGQDGYNWFIGQVTNDAAWRQHSKKYGYRVKVRILHKHSPTTPDEDLPWAHVGVSPQFGAGKAMQGTSLCLQGGEIVKGFFLDKDENVAFIEHCFQTESSVENLVAYNGLDSWQFYENDAKPSLEWGLHSRPLGGGDPSKINGVQGTNYQLSNNDSNLLAKVVEKKVTVTVAEKCKGGAGFGGTIARSLATFIEIAGSAKDINGTYIDPIMDEIRDIAGLVRQTSELIAGAYAQVIRLARKFLFSKIYELVEQLMGFLQLDSLLKDIAVKKAVDTIYCVLENIIKSLVNVISEFLIGLIGKLVQAPLCAAEQFLAGLNTRMFNDIESQIGSALDSISGILGPIGNFMGYLDKAMNYAQIGKQFLSCEGAECEPQPFDWAVNIGPTQKSKIDFKRTIDISSKFNVLGIGKSVTDGIDKFFGLDADDEENAKKVAEIVGDCPTDRQICGPPKIEIFGGGGFGAAANAVVNEFGEIVGVNMQSLGAGYTTKPFVSFIDNCEGRGAEGEAILEDGKVINIIVRRGGGGYQTPPDITDSEGTDVVGEIEGVEIIRTGRGYEPDDIITSKCGQLKPILDDAGRIVGASVINAELGCKVIPDLTINTETGYGALLRPIMRYRKVEDYDSTIPADGIMRVVDCVSSY